MNGNGANGQNNPFSLPDWADFVDVLLRHGGSFAFFIFIGTVLLAALLWADLSEGLRWLIISPLVILAFAMGLRFIWRPALPNKDKGLLRLLISLETGQVPPWPQRHISKPIRVSMERLLDFFNRLNQ